MEKNKIKKVAVTLSLAAVIGLGGTLAYINNVTNTVENKFNSSKNSHITGTVEEDKWSEKEASKYQPGDVLAKNPTVKLEKESENAWAAMSLKFVDSEGKAMNYNDFTKYAEIVDLNKTDWTLIAKNGEGSELYAHKAVVTPVDPTKPLFENIKVNTGITTVTNIKEVEHYYYETETDGLGNVTRNLVKVEKDDPIVAGKTYYSNVNGEEVIIGQGTATNATKLPQFQIDVTGYAVQEKNITQDEAKAELIKLANAKAENPSQVYKAV